jgi:hypothetical protein
MPATDLLGNPLGEVEAELLDLYGRTKALLGRDDLAPCVRAGARAALVALWNVTNDLALQHEHLLDLGA